MSDDVETRDRAGIGTIPTLFQVRPDVPFKHAFEELSVMLGCIRHLTLVAEMEGDHLAGSAARLLSAFAKTLITDMEQGLNKLH